MRLALWLPLSLAAGFACGYACFVGPRASISNSADVAPSSPGKAWSANAAAWPDSAQATDLKTQRLIAAALRTGATWEREHELYVAIEALNADDFRRAMRDLGALKAIAGRLERINQNQQRELVTGLVYRWLEVDSATAMSWAPRIFDLLPSGVPVRGMLLGAIAAKQPEQLLALLSSHHSSSDRIEIISSALSELASRDPAKARTWLEKITDPAERRAAEKAVRTGSVLADPLRAVELAGATESRQEGMVLMLMATRKAESMGPGVLRQLATTPMPQWMLPALFTSLAQEDPGLAVDLALKGGSEPGATTPVVIAFRSLAYRDPKQAIAKLEGLTGESLTSAVAALGEGWADVDPPAALNWLAEQPAENRKNPNDFRSDSHDVLLGTFSSWFARGPDEARAWADGLPPGELRSSVQTQLARALASNGDPAGAVQVLSSLGRAADPKLIAELAGEWARTDPPAAAAWAVGQPPGTSQSRAIASVVGRWANENPEEVADWLSQFPQGEARDRSVVAYLNRTIAFNATPDEQIAEFDAWFETMTDPWQRAQAAVRSFWTRRDSDPVAARRWLTALPNVDAGTIRLALINERR